MAQDPKKAGKSASGTDEKPASGGVDLAAIRSKLAQVVWIACVVFAMCLAVGALCIALKANEDNGAVSFILGMADRVDLGIFSQDGGIKEFAGENAEVKNALFNWGLGAVFWLIVGRILEKIIRP